MKLPGFVLLKDADGIGSDKWICPVCGWDYSCHDYNGNCGWKGEAINEERLKRIKVTQWEPFIVKALF